MQTQIGKSVFNAKKLLSNGKLVAIPTETVYGLAANAFDLGAVSSVFRAKNRPSFDPLIVHVSNLAMAEKIAIIPDELRQIVNILWPGPITILCKKKSSIDNLVTAGSDFVAIRVPNHSLTLSLLDKLSFPLVAPSANPFGYVSPTSARHVFDSLNGKVDYILNGGSCKIGLESTIISYHNSEIIIHRLGGISALGIAALIDLPIRINIQNNSNPAAPGMLDKHYSPKVLLRIISPKNKEIVDENSALICFGSQRYSKHKYILNLSKTDNLDEAAQNIFSFLRKLDTLSINCAYAYLVPEYGLGAAINDRLKRAAVH